MSLLLLDTTFLIDAERASDDLEVVIGDEDDVAIAAVTYAELSVGVRLAGTRQRPRRQAFVDAVSAAIPIISYDERIALHHSDLLVAVRSAGQPRGAHDLMIAATARATNRTVVSADRRAFDALPGVRAVDHRSS